MHNKINNNKSINQNNIYGFPIRYESKKNNELKKNISPLSLTTSLFPRLPNPTNTVEETPLCAICLNNIEWDGTKHNQGTSTNLKAMLLDCSHLFHEACIQQWMQTGFNNSCPECKNEPTFKEKFLRLNQVLSHVFEYNASLNKHSNNRFIPEHLRKGYLLKTLTNAYLILNLLDNLYDDHQFISGINSKLATWLSSLSSACNKIFDTLGRAYSDSASLTNSPSIKPILNYFNKTKNVDQHLKNNAILLNIFAYDLFEKTLKDEGLNNSQAKQYFDKFVKKSFSVLQNRALEKLEKNESEEFTKLSLMWYASANKQLKLKGSELSLSQSLGKSIDSKQE